MSGPDIEILALRLRNGELGREVLAWRDAAEDDRKERAGLYTAIAILAAEVARWRAYGELDPLAINIDVFNARDEASSATDANAIARDAVERAKRATP
jgi:hypothetical protein